MENNGVDTTTFYYRLIELCNMREELNNKIDFKPKNALWKSKLNYIIRRNIRKEDNNFDIYKKLYDLIEKGQKFKPSLFLKIYQNRDEKKC